MEHVWNKIGELRGHFDILKEDRTPIDVFTFSPPLLDRRWRTPAPFFPKNSPTKCLALPRASALTLGKMNCCEYER